MKIKGRNNNTNFHGALQKPLINFTCLWVHYFFDGHLKFEKKDQNDIEVVFRNKNNKVVFY